jgi:hypothetical protein
MMDVEAVQNVETRRIEDLESKEIILSVREEAEESGRKRRQETGAFGIAGHRAGQVPRKVTML